MDTQTIFAITLLVVLLMLVVFTWTSYPNAKYVLISRSDNISNFIGIQSIDVIDNKGKRRDIVALEGKGSIPAGYSNYAAASASTATSTNTDVTFNGRAMGYFKDDSSGSPIIGPVIAGIKSSSASSGYIILDLGCSVKIARIDIKSADDDISRLNIQRVKVVLLDKDKTPIKGAEQIIPVSSSIPLPTIHHINFV